MDNQDSIELKPQQQSPQELAIFCAERMQWAENMFPSQLRPTPETKRAYTAEWLELVCEIGATKFSEALVSAVRSSEYFPVIARIRECAGIGSKQSVMAEAEASWLYMREYFRKFSVYDKGQPQLPDRIRHALRVIGGRDFVESADYDALPFVRKDFCAAWERYNETSEAYNNLLLQSPLTRKMLQMEPPDPRPPNASG